MKKTRQIKIIKFCSWSVRCRNTPDDHCVLQQIRTAVARFPGSFSTVFPQVYPQTCPWPDIKFCVGFRRPCQQTGATSCRELHGCPRGLIPGNSCVQITAKSRRSFLEVDRYRCFPGRTRGRHGIAKHRRGRTGGRNVRDRGRGHHMGVCCQRHRARADAGGIHLRTVGCLSRHRRANGAR